MTYRAIAGLLIVFLIPPTTTPAASLGTTGVWLKEDGAAKIEIRQCGPGPQICSRIIWLREPNDSWGSPLRDARNENPSLRNRPIIGIPILRMAPAEPGKWKGRIYNPEDGRTYAGTLTLVSEQQLVLRGCKTLGLICSQKTWHRSESAEESVASDKRPASPLSSQPDPFNSQGIPQQSDSPLTQAIPTAVIAGNRVALVIGNSDYRSIAKLDNPANDAKLMANALKAVGFKLVGGGAQLDLDKDGFDSIVQRFGHELPGANIGLFYYAGHGVQLRGSNYLVPVSADPTREADADFQMIDIAVVLRQMERAGMRLKLVMLDACRNNPFGGRGLRAIGSGLAQMQAPEGTLISYATQPGNVAQDGLDGHSPYTKALAETIRKPGLGVFQTFNQVGLIVKRATAGAQQPWFSSSPIKGTFYFVAPPAPASVPTAGENNLAR